MFEPLFQSWSDSWQLWFFQVESTANLWVTAQLQHVSPVSLVVVFAAGLLTSLSPCMLSMLPITMGYIGGYSGVSQRQSLLHSLSFALGLATTLAGLGLAAALLGRIYGQVGSLWTVVIGGVAILMGLNLLELVPMPLPTWLSDVDVSHRWPGMLRAYAVGLLFGVTASPCSTPVLVALLGWVSTTGNPAVGSLLLLTYALGLVMPILVAGTFAGTLKRLLSVRRWSGWLTYASGAVLVAFGTLSILTQLV